MGTLTDTGAPGPSPSVATPTATTSSECSNPITLRRTATNTVTGEVQSKEISKRCNSRLESRCPSCSALYRGDAFQVIRSTVFDNATKLPKLVTMVTLTAPGSDRFGQTHSRNFTQSKGNKSQRVKRCACRKYHNEGDPLIGTPLNPSTYDYEAAVAFNANASRLFAVTMQKLSRVVGRKLQVVRVVEFQSRGLVHVHALILGPIPECTLQLVVRGGINRRTGREIKPASSGDWTWGPQCKADVVMGKDPGRAIAYMVKVVKYALKDAGRDECRIHQHGDAMVSAAEKHLKCGCSIYDCEHGSRTMSVTRSTVNETTNTVDTRSFLVAYQGHAATFSCRRHRRAVNGWGFVGHVLAKSRNWGFTFREVRERRMKWVTASKPQLPTNLVVRWEILPSQRGLACVSTGTSPP